MNNPDFTFAPNENPPEPEPVVETPPPPPEPPRARRGFPGLTLLLFLILAGGLYVVWADPPQLAPYTKDGAVERLQRQVQGLSTQYSSSGSQDQSQVQALTQQMQALSAKVDRLEKSVTQLAATPAASAPAGAAPADTGDLPKQVADLSSRVDALANRPAAAAPAPDNSAAQQAVADLSQKLDQAVTAQNARLDQLQAQQKGAGDALASKVAALEQGAGKVAGTADRAALLTRVQAAEVALLAGEKLGTIPNAPPALARFANVKPPTDAELREAFPAVAEHARGVSQPDLAKKSFLQRSWLRLQESVTVRQGDDVLVGDPAAGILADAQAKVQSDDLQGAVNDLQKLHGPAADAVKDWMDQANALLAARSALAAMAAQN